MLTFEDLLQPQSFDEMQEQLYEALKGRGVVTHEGAGAGTLVRTGEPTGERTITITITATGEPSTVVLTWTDGTLAGGGTPDLAGLFALTGTGITLQFVAATQTPSFVAGDTYVFRTWPSVVNFTAFQSGTTGPTLMRLDADALADLDAFLVAATMGGLLTYSSGVWLTELASEVYGLTRRPAEVAVGVMRLACVPTEGPHVITAGQLWVVEASGKRYNNVTGGVLASGGTLDLQFQAEGPGADYNIANNATLTLGTPILAGVSVTNPPDPGTGMWLTAQGVDEESDSALKERCRAQWATLGSGSPAAAYRLWALTVAGVTRVLVRPDPVAPGNVNVVVAGPSGPVAPSVVAEVLAYLEPRVPLCSTVDVASAVALPLTITATITALASKRPTVEAVVPAQMAELQQLVAIGPTTLRLNTIERYLWADGVTRVAVALPPGDTALAYGQVVVFTLNLSYVDAVDESEVSV